MKQQRNLIQFNWSARLCVKIKTEHKILSYQANCKYGRSMFVGAVVSFTVLHAGEHTSEARLSQMVEHFLQLHCQVMQLKSRSIQSYCCCCCCLQGFHLSLLCAVSRII